MLGVTSARKGGQLLAALSLALLALITRPGLSVRATSITVNSTADGASDDGQCTLREAIAAANTDTASGGTVGECAAGIGDDTIDLAGISGTIDLASPLPDLASELVGHSTCESPLFNYGAPRTSYRAASGSPRAT